MYILVYLYVYHSIYICVYYNIYMYIRHWSLMITGDHWWSLMAFFGTLIFPCFSMAQLWQFVLEVQTSRFSNRFTKYTELSSSVLLSVGAMVFFAGLQGSHSEGLSGCMMPVILLRSCPKALVAFATPESVSDCQSVSKWIHWALPAGTPKFHGKKTVSQLGWP